MPTGSGSCVLCYWSPDVIISKFFYALGYHVPENYIVHFTADQLELGKGVAVTDAKGKSRPIKERYCRAVRTRPARSRRPPPRRCQLYLTGKPLGPFKYFGVYRDWLSSPGASEPSFGNLTA